MMPVGKLSRMVMANTFRSPKHLALSAFGIVIGTAMAVVFLSSTEQIGGVLQRMFPVEEVEVVAPQVSLIGKDVSKRLDDSTVETIRKRADVAKIVPRMSLALPAWGTGTFEGETLSLDISGSADGVDPEYVVNDPTLSPEERTRIAGLFKDWETDENRGQRISCEPRPLDEALAANYDNPCPEPDRHYCDAQDHTCHHRVPVVLSPFMLQLYNTQYAKSHNTPLVTDDFAKFIIARGGLGRLRFDFELGETRKVGAPSRRVEAFLIGISSKAKRIGITLPIQYISRWNTEFKGKEVGTAYSSLVVTLKQADQIGPFGQWLQKDLDLRLEDSLGERFATVLLVIRWVLVVISLIIIVISAINIAHNFFMQVNERKRELGLMRALGATRADVRTLVMGEAAMVGIIGGGLGVACGYGLSRVVDWLSNTRVADFPFKPKTWFQFQPWIILVSLGGAVLFAIIGGYLPARRASKLEPATALSQV